MPRYAYKCEACQSEFEITHGMFFEQEQCIKCKRSGFLSKIFDFAIDIKNKEEPRASPRPGKVVDEFIREAKKDLKTQKKEAREEF